MSWKFWCRHINFCSRLFELQIALDLWTRVESTTSLFARWWWEVAVRYRLVWVNFLCTCFPKEPLGLLQISVDFNRRLNGSLEHWLYKKPTHTNLSISEYHLSPPSGRQAGCTLHPNSQGQGNMWFKHSTTRTKIPASNFIGQWI
jgi:hypothetical protein